MRHLQAVPPELDTPAPTSAAAAAVAPIPAAATGTRALPASLPASRRGSVGAVDELALRTWTERPTADATPPPEDKTRLNLLRGRRDSSGLSPGVPPQFNAAFLNDDDADAGPSLGLGILCLFH
jgi:hypothetical protein